MINFYRHLTNVAMICLLGILLAGVMVGCTLEGDTYSGTVTSTECNESPTTGVLNCGTGSPVDDHHSEEIAAE